MSPASFDRAREGRRDRRPGARRFHRVLCAALAALVLLGGCAARIRYLQATPVGEGPELSVLLSGPGEHRVLVQREATSRPWNTLLLRNPTPTRLRGVQLWDLGGVDLLGIDPAPDAPGLHPFTLLPGEQLICTTTEARDDVPRLLTGTLVWQWNGAESKDAWPGVLRHVQPANDGGLILNAQGVESSVEVVLDAPLPHTAIRLAWDLEGSAAVLPFISTDGRVWIRVAKPRIVDLQHPMDLGPTVSGHRRVALRLVREGTSPSNRPAILRRLHLEREVRAPGGLRPWPAGLSEARLKFQGGADGRLEVRLQAL